MNILLSLIIGIGVGQLIQLWFKADKLILSSNFALGIWGSVVGSLLCTLLGLSTYSLIGSLLVAFLAVAIGQSLVSLLEVG